MVPFDVKKFDFTEAEALSAAADGRLLSAEIEFNRSCNYRCPYCYAAGSYDNCELGAECARDAIRQATALGARKIVVLGGEPLLCRELKEHIELICSLGMAAEVFTNASLVTPRWAEFFFTHGCRVVVKLNSLRPEVQEKLTGVPGALDKALRAIRILQDAGMDADRLAASTVISTVNEDDIVGLWQYLREHDVRPYVEIMTPQGRLLQHRALEVPPSRIKEIFDRIAAYDRAHGYDWEPQPPLVGCKCLRHQYSCVINAAGDVTPCVGVTVTLGNIRQKPLADILAQSNVLRNLKDFRRTIKGPCRECDKAETCYGCRGAAYQLTGDYLASDPLCWRNAGTVDPNPSLPSPAAQWLPHRPPMAMVDALAEFGEWSRIEATIAPDNLFLRDGVLDSEALPEIAAQASAVVSGFEEENHQIRGMLTGVRDVTVSAPVHCGDKLAVWVRKSVQIDNYYTVDFRICLPSGEVCAQGELSLCRLDG